MVLSKDLKFAICFGLIIGALFSFCSLCFAAELDEVELGTLSNVRVYDDVLSSGSLTFAYFEIEPGFVYHITNTAANGRALWYSTGIELGSQCSQSISLGSGETYDVFRNGGYVYLLGSSGPISYSVTREPYGISNFILSVASTLSFVNLNEILNIVVPILAISVLLGLGYYFIKRIMNKIKRAKGGV